MFVRANRRVLGALEGQYVSLSRGRSMDFDDLRAYVSGDEVKDIDWKATARFGSPLVRNYSANRQHELVLLVDTGLTMAARSASGEPKSELAILVAGIIGYLAIRHGDRVSLAHGDDAGIHRMPSVGTEGELERLLRRIDSSITPTGPRSDLTGLVTDALRVIRRRSIVVVIADDTPMTAGLEDAARRLNARHELLWCTIGDADLVRGIGAAPGGAARSALVDIADEWDIPEFVFGNERLQAEFDAAEAAVAATRADALEALRISHVRVDSGAGVVTALLSMLGRRAHARR